MRIYRGHEPPNEEAAVDDDSPSEDRRVPRAQEGERREVEVHVVTSTGESQPPIQIRTNQVDRTTVLTIGEPFFSSPPRRNRAAPVEDVVSSRLSDRSGASSLFTFLPDLRHHSNDNDDRDVVVTY